MELNDGAEAHYSARQTKVLLVDDDRFMHEMLDLILRRTEYSLVSAKNVDEAMKMIASEKPDIVITDAMMPGESGFSFIARMKNNPQTASIPIILWTILEEVNGSVMDASCRADISIQKPFYRSDILEGLEKAKRLIQYNGVSSDVYVTFDKM